MDSLIIIGSVVYDVSLRRLAHVTQEWRRLVKLEWIHHFALPSRAGWNAGYLKINMYLVNDPVKRNLLTSVHTIDGIRPQQMQTRYWTWLASTCCYKYTCRGTTPKLLSIYVKLGTVLSLEYFMPWIDGGVCLYAQHRKKARLNRTVSGWFSYDTFLFSLEVECWAHASESLSILSTLYANSNTTETIGRVNRLINAWPPDDTPPAEGIGHMKTVQHKLSSGLSDIIAACDQEIKYGCGECHTFAHLSY